MRTFATLDHNIVTARLLTHRANIAIDQATNTVVHAAYLRSVVRRARENRAARTPPPR